MARPAEDRFEMSDLKDAVNQMNSEQTLDFHQVAETAAPVEVEEAPKEESSEEEGREEGQEVKEKGDKAPDQSEPPQGADKTPPTAKELSDEELDNTFITTKVYGEVKKVSLREARDNYQMQEAAKSKLDEAKLLVAEYKNLLEQQKKVQTSQPAEAPKAESGEYVDPITAELNRVRQEIEAIKGFNQSQVSRTLQAKEDAEVAKIIGADKPEEVRAKIIAVVQANPNFAPIASKLFNGSPQSEDDMAERVGFFDALYTKAKSMNLDLPQVVREAKEAGKEEGKREAKKSMKQNLVTVDGGKDEGEDKENRKSELSRIRTTGVKGAASYFEKHSKLLGG